MLNYSDAEEWNEQRLLDERKSIVIRFERELKELEAIDRALTALRSSNGGEPKREGHSAESQR